MSRTSSPHKSKCTCIENNATARRVKNETMMPGRRAKRRTHKHTGRAQQNVRKKVHYRESQKNRSHTHTHTHTTHAARVVALPFTRWLRCVRVCVPLSLPPTNDKPKLSTQFFITKHHLLCVCVHVYQPPFLPLPKPPPGTTVVLLRLLLTYVVRVCVCVPYV